MASDESKGIQKEKTTTEERIERLDWYVFIGDILLLIPRVFSRILRRVFDWS